MFKFAVLGLGRMGTPVARRLLGADQALAVWNRSPKAMEALRASLTDTSRLTLCNCPTEAVKEADLVITLLSDGPAVHEVLFEGGVAHAMRPGSVLADMSSISPRLARAHAEALLPLGVAAVDAPVSGGVVGAAEGSLAIMAGGETSVVLPLVERLKPLGRVTHVGPSGAGQLAKLANQVIVGITIGAVAEALLLAKAGGADPGAVRAAIRGGFAESRILELHGARMLDDDYVPGGSITTQLKDLSTALQEAEALELQLPVTALLKTLFESAKAAGDEGLDHAALLRELARMNGRSPHQALK